MSSGEDIEKEAEGAEEELVAEERPDEDVIQEEGEQIVASLQQEVRENYDKYLRAVAELENFKKRAQKERSDLLKYAGEALARDLLEVIDNLELALGQTPVEENNQFAAGIRMVYQNFLSILERHSIKSQSVKGEKFNPATHEALTTLPTAEAEPGTVVEEFKKAYFFRDKLLRAGQVVVASEPTA